MIAFINRDTTAAALEAIKAEHGIVSLTLTERGGLYTSHAATYEEHQRWSEDDLLAVGCGLDATTAVNRAVVKFIVRMGARKGAAS